MLNRKARRASLSKQDKEYVLINKSIDASAFKVLYGPEHMSLSIGQPDTLRFLREIRRLSTSTDKDKSSVVDLSKTKTLELSAALALVAELDSWQRRNVVRLTPRTVADWHPDIVNELSALGFFRLLQTKIPAHLPKSDGKAWIQFVSDTRTIGKAASLLRRKLAGEHSISPTASQSIYIGLVEAMKNTFDHAYPDNAYLWSEDMMIGKRWWMAASIDRSRNLLEIAFMDTGITIPHSLPTSWLWDNFSEEVRCGNDSDLIREAMRYGMSSKGQAHRGKGLTDITRAARDVTGYISILSRAGMCFVAPSEFVQVDISESLAGTLIKWYFALDGRLSPEFFQASK